MADREAAPLPVASESAKLFIDGEFVDADSGNEYPSINPSTGEVISMVAAGDSPDIDRAVGAARRAFDSEYSRFSPVERQRALLLLAELIEANYDELRRLDALDMGQPLGAQPLDSTGAADVLRYFAGWATKIAGETLTNSAAGAIFSMTVREPVGVVGAIIPWNGPLLAVMWKLGPALAAGCTIVLKPAEDASLCALRIAEMTVTAGFPRGTVNVVTGFGHTAGAALAAHPGVDKLTFTGSTATGQNIMRSAAGNLKRLSLEMGGKAPDILFADADLAKAVPFAAMGVFANTGQVCCAGTRIFVAREIYNEVCAGVSDFADGLRVGNSLDSSTDIGPVVSARQLSRVESYVGSGLAEGAKLLAGGGRPADSNLAHGFFVRPTVFADVTDDMTIAREEIFGPVASILAFDSEEEVIARANRTTYGLGGGVWTRDVGRALRVSRGLQTGTVWVNTYLTFDPAVPFGGYKMSGWGSDLGEAAIDGHLNTKSIWIDMEG